MALTPIAVDGYFMAGHGLSAMGSGLLRACDAVGIPALPARVEDLRIAGFAPADLTAAVAILAEIIARRTGRGGRPLREVEGPIRRQCEVSSALAR